MGKDKILLGARLYVGGYDFSGQGIEPGTLQDEMGRVPMYGWDQVTKWFIPSGRREVGIDGLQVHMDDTADTGTMTSIAAKPSAESATFAIGQNGAAPAAADPAYLVPPLQDGAQLSWNEERAVLSANFVMDSAKETANYDKPWGVVLLPLTALTASTNGTVVDLGAAGADGAAANLHITVSGPGDFAFVIEDSPTGAFGGEETTLITFDSDGSAVGGEFDSVSGAVLQYVRVKVTRTSGTCSAMIALTVN